MVQWSNTADSPQMYTCQDDDEQYKTVDDCDAPFLEATGTMQTNKQQQHKREHACCSALGGRKTKVAGEHDEGEKFWSSMLLRYIKTRVLMYRPSMFCGRDIL